MKKIIRIGFIGAGRNTREAHLVNLQHIEGVEFTAVCNRSAESSLKVAEQFNIKKVCTHWREITDDPEIDAIVIGTWPELHEPITVQALRQGKHVLCEARMARNASEAKNMLDESRRNPHLVAQVVPSPFTLSFDRTITDLIDDGYLGDILAANVRYNFNHFLDKDEEMTPRTNSHLSGLNCMVTGIIYEGIARWIGHARSVQAMGSNFTQFRTWSEGYQTVEVPEHLNIIADMYCGAQLNMQFSSITGLLDNSNEIWLFGSEGTLFLDLHNLSLKAGKKGDKKLQNINATEHFRNEWRVEEEFINAIRQREQVKLTTFEQAYRYMEFTEAVARSSATGQSIQLPLNLNN